MSAYQPLEIVVARLETAAEQLKNADDGPCKDLANIIEEALKPCQPPAASPSPARLRALLQQALNALDDRDDTDFAKLAGWQNKASWLVGCGLFTIVVLTFTIPHHSVLFVVGAAGGLISRMSRSLNRKDVPTDYGASWTTLFSAPCPARWARGPVSVEMLSRLMCWARFFRPISTSPAAPSRSPWRSSSVLASVCWTMYWINWTTRNKNP